jgi:hypothetical protein
MTLLTKEALSSALARRAVTPILLDDLIYELHRAECLPEPDDEAQADAQALRVEADAAAVTNGGLSSQLDYLISALGSPAQAALALNDFLNLPVVYH